MVEASVAARITELERQVITSPWDGIAKLKACSRFFDTTCALSAAPFFKGRRKVFLSAIAENMQVEIFGPGDIVITAGEIGDKMYFLRRGLVNILVGPNHDIKVATLGVNSIIGEMALFGSGFRSATVQAIEVCDTRVIDLEAFQRILKHFPQERRFYTELAEERMRELEKVRAQNGVEPPAAEKKAAEKHALISLTVRRRRTAGRTPRPADFGPQSSRASYSKVAALLTGTWNGRRPAQLQSMQSVEESATPAKASGQCSMRIESQELMPQKPSFALREDLLEVQSPAASLGLGSEDLGASMRLKANLISACSNEDPELHPCLPKKMLFGSLEPLHAHEEHQQSTASRSRAWGKHPTMHELQIAATELTGSSPTNFATSHDIQQVESPLRSQAGQLQSLPVSPVCDLSVLPAVLPAIDPASSTSFLSKLLPPKGFVQGRLSGAGPQSLGSRATQDGMGCAAVRSARTPRRLEPIQT